LQNVELELHDESKGEGFDLKFTFDEQSYFEPLILVKEIHMKSKGIVEKMVSTNIEWKDGCDPTKKKIKRKKKGKKINVEVKQDSFFNFFKDEPEPKDGGEEKEAEKKEEAEEDDELEDMIDEHQQMAEQIKDDLVPLALEYYLGVIEQDDDDEDFEDDEEEEEEPADKKKKKKGKGKAGEVDPKECKQQ